MVIQLDTKAFILLTYIFKILIKKNCNLNHDKDCDSFPYYILIIDSMYYILLLVYLLLVYKTLTYLTVLYEQEMIQFWVDFILSLLS